MCSNAEVGVIRWPRSVSTIGAYRMLSRPGRRGYRTCVCTPSRRDHPQLWRATTKKRVRTGLLDGSIDEGQLAMLTGASRA